MHTCMCTWGGGMHRGVCVYTCMCTWGGGVYTGVCVWGVFELQSQDLTQYFSGWGSCLFLDQVLTSFSSSGN